MSIPIAPEEPSFSCGLTLWRRFQAQSTTWKTAE
jgi:hypothetical protein